MFKRTGWVPTEEAHARRCDCGFLPGAYGPYDTPQLAAERVNQGGWVAGEVIFFDWDDPPSMPWAWLPPQLKQKVTDATHQQRL